MPILKNLKQHKLLLDTHVWLWVMLGSSFLKKEFVLVVEKKLKTQGVFISPMSIWEIGMLVEKKRIEIEMDVLDWVNQALEVPGINLCPLTPRIAVQSTRLPGNVHGDPVDRLLIATAYEESAILVTCDKKIIEFGAGRWIGVFDPRGYTQTT
ncbi:MAG TPA: type II toxin-antitoxin system VapC family toxin [Rhabdochlamydiaceae bacterium]|nr:type II toxin-antitoxin system VapC family toxin [Rhabdochlamydiaceae bacterium]